MTERRGISLDGTMAGKTEDGEGGLRWDPIVERHPGRKYFGIVNVDRYFEICRENGVKPGQIRILVNEPIGNGAMRQLDVTDRCKEFSDEPGNSWVWVLTHDMRGACEAIYGEVQLRRASDGRQLDKG